MVIESKKEKLLTLDVQKRLVWELMERRGQPGQEPGESFPDKGNSKHKSPEIETLWNILETVKSL